MDAKKNAGVENGNQAEKEKQKEIPEFTESDVENLYLSATEIQQKACRKLDGVEINSLPLDLEVELAKFIGKLKKWVVPLIESKSKVAKSFGFVQQGNSYIPAVKMTDDELVTKRGLLLSEFETKNLTEFAHTAELKKLMPLKLFTQSRIKESNVYFRDCPSKQMFLQYCIPEPDKP